MPSFPFQTPDLTDAVFLPDADPRGRGHAFTASAYLDEADMPTFNAALKRLLKDVMLAERPGR